MDTDVTAHLHLTAPEPTIAMTTVMPRSEHAALKKATINIADRAGLRTVAASTLVRTMIVEMLSDEALLQRVADRLNPGRV